MAPFDNFKGKPSKRLFDSAAVAAVAAAVAAPAAAAAAADDDSMDTGADSGNSKRARDGALSGLTIAVIGKLSATQAKLKARITKLGATLHTGTLGSFVTAALSTEKEVDKDSKKVKEANSFGVPIVKESWLDECEAKDTCARLQDHLITCSSTVVEPSDEINSRALKKARKDAAAAAPAQPASNPQVLFLFW